MTNSGLTIMSHFSQITDPRMKKKTAHKLEDIITIAILAVICGADGWTDVQEFGKAKRKWLKTFLELSHGIPSHDTFGRVFSLICAEEFERAFLSWVRSIVRRVKGVVPLDGKTVRRSHDASAGQKAIHLVSAWASANGVMLGQIKTEEKSNEITALPELLELLEIKGCIVTIDAMGCQKAVAEKIVEKKAEYCLALKGNQEGLYEEVYALFQQAHETNFEGMEWDSYETDEHNHGRHEIRRYWTLTDLSSLPRVQEWPRLRMVGMVEAECTRQGKTSIEHRFYISSLAGKAKPFAQAVRKHWGIENTLHWVLDIAFREDECRIRRGEAAENFAILRRLALALIRQEETLKVGVKAKRLRAGWDESYLLQLLRP